jgi:hypothetical protein
MGLWSRWKKVLQLKKILHGFEEINNNLNAQILE